MVLYTVFNGEIGIYREPVEASPPAEFCIKNLDLEVSTTIFIASSLKEIIYISIFSSLAILNILDIASLLLSIIGPTIHIFEISKYFVLKKVICDL